jgi:hypothetical protein
MSIEIVVASVTAILGLSSVLKSIFNLKGKRKAKGSISINFKDGHRIEVPSDIPHEDLEKLINRLKETESKDLGASIVGVKQKEKNEGGFVTSEFLMYFVPGVIAIAFAGTFIYLIISHQDTAGYNIPKELSSAMATIIGYFFGVGVSNATNKGQQLSAEDIQKLIGAQDP